MTSGWWCPGEAPAGHQLCSVGQQRKLEVGNGSRRQRPVPFTIRHWLLLGHSSVGLHFSLICPSVSPGLSVYWTSMGLIISQRHLSRSFSRFHLGTSLHQFHHGSPPSWSSPGSLWVSSMLWLCLLVCLGLVLPVDIIKVYFGSISSLPSLLCLWQWWCNCLICDKIIVLCCGGLSLNSVSLLKVEVDCMYVFPEI